MQASPTIQEVKTELDSNADTSVVSDATALITQDVTSRLEFLFWWEQAIYCKHCHRCNWVCWRRDRRLVYAGSTSSHPSSKADSKSLGLMQLQHNGILINDEPKHIVPKPTEEHHCIKIPSTKDRDQLNIPLLIKECEFLVSHLEANGRVWRNPRRQGGGIDK